MTLIKISGIVVAILAVIGIFTLGFLSGKYTERQSQLLTPDSREFLHGHKLDLPEELIGCDSLDNLGVKWYGDTLGIVFKEKGFIMPMTIVSELDSTAHAKGWPHIGDCSGITGDYSLAVGVQSLMRDTTSVKVPSNTRIGFERVIPMKKSGSTNTGINQ